LLDQLREAARQRGHPEATAAAFTDCCRRFILFHGKRHPRDLGLAEVGQFLESVARTEKDPGTQIGPRGTVPPSGYASGHSSGLQTGLCAGPPHRPGLLGDDSRRKRRKMNRMPGEQGPGSGLR